MPAQADTDKAKAKIEIKRKENVEKIFIPTSVQKLCNSELVRITNLYRTIYWKDFDIRDAKHDHNESRICLTNAPSKNANNLCSRFIDLSPIYKQSVNRIVSPVSSIPVYRDTTNGF